MDLAVQTAGAHLVAWTGDDSDTDGVADAGEQGPDGTDPNYDGNNDVTPDSQQGNVVSLPSYYGNRYLTIASPPGTTITDCHSVPIPSPLDAPPALGFPCGFVKFTVNGVGVGGAVQITKYLPFQPSTCYKYGATPENTTPHWYEFLFNGQTGAQLTGYVATYYLVDGLRGDDDLTANGSIVEPSGLAELVAGIEEPPDGVPTEYALFQNYPNPFNPTTEIRFQISDVRFVTLAVYDLLGRGVAVLVNERKAPGSYTVQFNGNGLASGMYFYRLKAGDFVATKKLLLLK